VLNFQVDRASFQEEQRAQKIGWKVEKEEKRKKEERRNHTKHLQKQQGICISNADTTM